MNKKIPAVENDSLSSIIKNRMDSKGITPEKLAKQTMVSDDFINMVVNGSFDSLPSRPYVHGYILKIADALDLDGKKLWKQHLKDGGRLRSSGEKDKLPENRFLVSRLNVKVFLGLIIAIFIVIYFFWQMFFAFSIGRVLSIEGFNDDTITTTNESVFIIEGEIKNGLRLLINDEETIALSDGTFKKGIVLRPGLNNIVFTVSGALGKKESLTKQVYYSLQNGENNEETFFEQEREEENIINIELNQ